MRGDAAEWWINNTDTYDKRNERRIRTWNELRKGLKQQFLPHSSRATAKAEYRKLQQMASVHDYNKEFSRAVARLPDLNETDTIIDYIEGLCPRVKSDIKTNIRTSQYEELTLEEVMAITVEIE